jgi:hypothetical protein
MRHRFGARTGHVRDANGGDGRRLRYSDSGGVDRIAAEVSLLLVNARRRRNAKSVASADAL